MTTIKIETKLEANKGFVSPGRLYRQNFFWTDLSFVLDTFCFLVTNFCHALFYTRVTFYYVMFLLTVSVIPYLGFPQPESFDEACFDALIFLAFIASILMIVLCFYTLSLVLGAGYSCYKAYRIHHLTKRIWKLRILCAPFDAQSGRTDNVCLEDTKENRRSLYRRHEHGRRTCVRRSRKPRASNKSKKIRYDSQVGFGTAYNFLGTFQKLMDYGGIEFTDDVLNKIENLVMLYGSLRDVQSTTQFMSIMGLYLKTNYSKSVVSVASQYLADVFDTEYDSQSGRFDVSDEEKPKWLTMLKECQENWSLLYKNPGAEKISKVLSLCIALGLCDAAHLRFEVAGMKLFSVGAAPKHMTAIDMIDAVFDTVVYFAEGGYVCFKQGSIKPLLYGGLDEQQFEEDYLKCMRCIDLARSGNLEKVEKISENDFDALLQKTKEKAKTLREGARGSLERNVLMRKIEMLQMWHTQFTQFRVQGGLRTAPYSIGVFGGTAVGKSSVANILMVTTLLHNDYSATDDRIVTLNERDKFWSNYRSYINGILNDDVGNTKPDFVENPPTQMKLQIVNNVRLYANMAEADLKGKVSVEPKVYIETKNVKDSCASIYSNEPASITRRDHICITVKVRPQFATYSMLDYEKVNAYYNGVVPRIPDLWEITVEKSYPIAPVSGTKANVGWRVIEWKGKALKDIALSHLIRYIGEDSKAYFANQDNVVEANSDLAGKLCLCPVCKHPKPDVCECEPLDVQFGKRIASYLKKKQRSFISWYRPTKEYWLDRAEDKLLSVVIDRLDWLYESRWVCWTNWVPSQWLQHPYFENAVFLWHKDELTTRIKQAYKSHISIILLFLVLGFFSTPLVFLLGLPSMCAISEVVKTEKKKLLDEISANNAAMPQVFKRSRDRHVKYICGACFVIFGLYAIASIWKQFKVMPDTQGNLSPSTVAEVKERDEEVNPWAGVKISPMPCTPASSTTTVDQLQSLAEDNTCHMVLTYEENGKVIELTSDAFFPCSNVAIIPKHTWERDCMKATFTRHDPTKIGGNFSSYIDRVHSVDIPQTDFSVVWVPNGGDWKDMRKYLPLDKFASVPGRLIYKGRDGSVKTSKLLMDTDVVYTAAGGFFGAHYNLSFPTFNGLCMAPVITETKGPLIGGFHLGGKEGEERGCSGFLSAGQLEQALNSLKTKPGVILSKSSGTLPKVIYDKQFFKTADVHPKSPVNFLPMGTNCKYYGQVEGRATYHTDVEESVISSLVNEICGVPQQWGGPKFNTGYPWQASLSHSTKPSIGMEAHLLVRAVEDYKKDLLKCLKEMPELKCDIRPLTEMETVCGVDGKRFLDKMPPNTSVGYPLSGPKSQFLTYLDPKECDTHQCPAVLDPKFWRAAEDMEKSYRNGERSYPIFKACLKDEPTKLTKDKVRVFQGAPLALQLLVRKYFLPVARFISMVPLVSECAVGVNSQGPEWDQLAKFVRKFGSKRILAGDYSKYDLRMPAQVMFAAFRIMIDLAIASGNYTDEDIVVMEGIASDICYPLMAYNGDLIQHFGSNPSGQNLTVYVNSIVNSLLFRCAFFSIYPEATSFRDAVALITYGDDAKSSVKEGYEKFNHIALADFLAEHDMKFTMPDKESTPTEYMDDSAADLLKRKNVYSPDLGFIVGALDENSNFKSLHANLKSKALTREQQAMQNIDGALRETFFHGREKYELRRQQFTEIAKRADIDHGCREIHVDFDQAVQRWKEKYIPEQLD